MQKQILCFIVLMIMSIGLITITSSVNYQSNSIIQLNSQSRKTISLNNDITRGGSTIFANGSLLYFLDDEYGFAIINVSIKDKLEVVGTFNYSRYLTSDYSNMIIQNKYVYFFSHDINRITILDCTNISDIKLFGYYTLPAGSYKKIAILDWNIFTITSTEFSIYNFTNFSLISLIDKYTNASSSFFDLTIQGNYAYILDYDYGLAIFNITDSTNIQKTNDLVLNDYAYTNFYLTDDYVYIYEESIGLQIYDVSNPLAPSNVTKYEISGSTINDLLIKGNNAFVLHSKSFDILDISNLLEIQLVGRYTTELVPLFDSISVDGNFAYLTSIRSGELFGRDPLFIVDITNLESPIHLFPEDPFQLLSDLARLLLIIAGVVSGVPVLFLAIFIPIFLTKRKKANMNTKGQM